MAERDKDYDAFYAKWKPRLGLKDNEIALGYMRGLGDQDGTLPEELAKTGVHVRVDGRGIDAEVDPHAVDELVARWAASIEYELNSREFTKNIICETIALNQHYGERGPAILAAAIWLISEEEGALAALREGGTALLVEFIYEEESKTRRMRRSVYDKEPATPTHGQSDAPK